MFVSLSVTSLRHWVSSDWVQVLALIVVELDLALVLNLEMSMLEQGQLVEVGTGMVWPVRIVPVDQIEWPEVVGDSEDGSYTELGYSVEEGHFDGSRPASELETAPESVVPLGPDRKIVPGDWASSVVP